MGEVANYWDWISIQDKQDYTDREDFASVAKDCLEQLTPMLDKMVWVDANIIYLNKVYDIPQHRIAEYLGISQYGVSKRLRKAMERLKVKVKCPEGDYLKAQRELGVAFGSSLGEIMCLYLFNTLSMVSSLYGEKTKFETIDRAKAFIKAKDEPIKYAIIAHGLAHLNEAQLRISKDYDKILQNEAKIKAISQKYSEYFELVLETSAIGEFVFNKAKKNNQQWLDKFI